MQNLERQNIIHRVLLGLLLAGVSTASVAQQGDDSFKTYHVAGNVHMLEPANTNGNVGVLSGEDDIPLIDDHFDFSVESLLRSIAAISNEEVRFVVNTHVHPDHMGGNNKLAAFGVTIIAHDTVRLQMLKDIRIPRRGGIFMDQPPAAARPILTYTEAISFHVNGKEVRVFLSPPAYTGGDSFVYFMGSDVLHLGDVFRTNMYPIIDSYNGGSFLGTIEAMGVAIGMAGPNTRVIPGHGAGPSDRQGILDYQGLLFTLRDRVQALIDDGNSIEQVLAAEPTKDLDARWGGVPSWTAVDLLPIIYAELTQ
ncbi:MAG: MBL fold metallo-hydrolase [Gammaproteobacteria bacterium]|nr:MBL fold metallo-hydrolase [Gammaproteobacteria bacterium]